jgi:hypothetical protein
MWVLLLLGVLPLAVLPTMFGDGPQGGDASHDDDLHGAGLVPSGGPSGGPSGVPSAVHGLPVGGWSADGDHPDPGAGPALGPDPGADDPPPVQPATLVRAPGDAPAASAGFVPGTDRVAVLVDPEGPPAGGAP